MKWAAWQFRNNTIISSDLQPAAGTLKSEFMISSKFKYFAFCLRNIDYFSPLTHAAQSRGVLSPPHKSLVTAALCYKDSLFTASRDKVILSSSQSLNCKKYPKKHSGRKLLCKEFRGKYMFSFYRILVFCPVWNSMQNFIRILKWEIWTAELSIIRFPKYLFLILFLSNFVYMSHFSGRYAFLSARLQARPYREWRPQQAGRRNVSD